MQLVDEEDRCVAVVEDQRVAQRRRPGVERLVPDQAVEDALVQGKGLVEVIADLEPLRFDVLSGEQYGAGYPQVVIGELERYFGRIGLHLMIFTLRTRLSRKTVTLRYHPAGSKPLTRHYRGLMWFLDYG